MATSVSVRLFTVPTFDNLLNRARERGLSLGEGRTLEGFLDWRERAPRRGDQRRHHPAATLADAWLLARTGTS